MSYADMNQHQRLRALNLAQQRVYNARAEAENVLRDLFRMGFIENGEYRRRAAAAIEGVDAAISDQYDLTQEAARIRRAEQAKGTL